jgi:type I restriction enzyme R subunit
VAAEKEVVPAQEQDRGKAALTELFKEVKNANTPVVAERIVNDIDAIVRAVRFDGWQQTTGQRRIADADVRRAGGPMEHQI